MPAEAVSAPLFVGARNALDLAFGIFLIAGLLRRQAVRGSAPRYRWATIQRACCWPGLLFIVFTTLRALGLMQPLALILVPAALAAWTYTYRQMRADADDDWFAGAAKRLRRAFGSRTASAHLAALGA